MKIRSPELTHLIPGNLYPLTVMSPLSPSPSPWQPPPYLVSVLAYLRFHTEVRFLQYLYFSYFISHNAFRSFHVVRRGRISFFSVDKQYSILCVYVCVFVYIYILSKRFSPSGSGWICEHHLYISFCFDLRVQPVTMSALSRTPHSAGSIILWKCKPHCVIPS